MPYRANYPATVAEVLDDRVTFKPAALAAVRALARAKPWRGTPREREAKLRECLSALSRAYEFAPGREPWLTVWPGRDCYDPASGRIFLSPRLSVVTLLHEFGHARGFDERQACRWSINLFRRCFPRSFSGCRQVGHMLLSAGPSPERN